MALIASIGTGADLDPRQAGITASRQAQAKLGRLPGGIGFAFVSHDYDFGQVMGAIASILTDLPLIGMSVSGAAPGVQGDPRSVVVALLSGDGLQARTRFWPQIGGIPPEFLKLPREKHTGRLSRHALMLVSDGFSGDTQAVLENPPQGGFDIFGALAAGNLDTGKAYQYGGGQSGSGGMAAAWIDGPIEVSAAAAHAWQPVGAYAPVTRAEGLWIREMDGQRASQFYANWFGHSDRAWAYPPLNQLVRLYPLGIERENDPTQEELTIHSPLRFEADGSLRMQTPVAQQCMAHVMVASAEGCRNAAKRAAQKALAGLHEATPALAIVLADVSWKMQMEPEIGAEFEAVQAVVGAGVPIVGGYTFGQFARSGSDELRLLNQHIQVILISGILR